jgi:D-3-phosphoglycerate dehydrogenase / 2-oxoglutarate reductase
MVWSSEGSRERARKDGCVAALSKETFSKECDVISLHVRLVDRTRGIVAASDLASMKPTALTRKYQARGACRAGRPGMAAIDVNWLRHPRGVRDSVF